MKKIFMLLILSVCLFSVFAQEKPEIKLADNIEKTTFIYAEKDTSVLKLDKYRLKNAKEIQPCIFFVFGGGFTNGERDNSGYNNYFNYLTQNGLTVISIDYRLGLSGGKQNIGITNYKPLQNAINLAVSDLFDATSFTLKNASEWKIDPLKFIITGSSAGAITVMQTEYENRNKLPLSSGLPPDFQYAGVISFAGAIFRTDGDLKWKNESPCPMMMLHGDADKVVPYNEIGIFRLGFYGSKHIAGKLYKNNFPYWFLSFKGAAHEVATVMMDERQQEVLEFIQRFILKGENTQIDMYINEMWKEKPKKTESYKDIY